MLGSPLTRCAPDYQRMEWDHGQHKPASGQCWTIINPGGWELFMRNAKSEHCLETITTIIARGRTQPVLLQLICMGNAKSYLWRKAMSARGVRGWVSETWVISWGLQFVWIIIRSITVNTSSDGVFTRNPPHCFISWWSLFYEIISLTFSKQAHFLIQLFTERLVLTFSILPILVIGCLLIININCVVRCEPHGPVSMPR